MENGIIDNQEDSIVLNKAAIDRGLFDADTLKKYGSVLEMNPSTSSDDIFMKPDRTKVTGMTQGSYEKLNEEGFIPEETAITDKDMIIGKVSPIQPTGDNKVFKDKSEMFKSNVDGHVDRVHHDVYDGDGYKMVNMRVRMERVPIIGDKFSTRFGQKGTLGLLLDQRDMPFTEEGMIPDIIFNPHGYPSRETVGQLLETICGKYAASTGKLFDGTPFDDYDVYKIPDLLKKIGYHPYGIETMYNGITGQKMKAQIFIGPVYYMRLKHMVNDKMHCLTPDHEVLTNNGWKNITQVSKEDKVASLVNNQLEYHHPLNTFEYNYQGKMYSIDFQVVTPNHKLYLSEDNENFYLKEAQELEDKVYYYRVDDTTQEKETKAVQGKWIDYSGKVYCLEVPSNIFYVRKDGIPSWTGNSRATGPKQAITRQPLEGRAKDGGLKIGEMERDAMIAHGVGQFLKERMMETSDITTVHVCDKCGLFAQKVMDKDYYECVACNNYSEISEVSVPYAFKLLIQELMAVNILPRIRT